MPHEPRTIDGRIERDVDDEIAFHIESRVSALMARGQWEETARRNAEAESGDVRAARRERRRRGPASAAARADHPVARRGRAGRPAGRSLASAIARIHDRRRAHAGHRHRSRSVANLRRGGWRVAPSASVWTSRMARRRLARHAAHRFDPPATIAADLLHDLRLAHAIEGIGVNREGEVTVADPRGGVEPQRVISASISATLIPVFQLPPILGHAFTDAEDLPGAP